MQKAIFVNTDYEAALQTPMGHDELALQDQSKASRQFAQPSLLRLGEKKAKTKTTI